jgi:hypothetical protein
MAIGRISGALLFSDLDRQGVDLSLTTNGQPLQHLDFTNFRFGVNTNALVDTFTVQGTANVSGVSKIYGNLVAAAGTPSTNTTTGALVVLGGFGVTGNLYAGNLHAANFTGNIVGPTGGTATFDNLTVTNYSVLANTTLANAIINSGYITGLANAYITLGYFDNLSTPNVVINGGYIANLTNATIATGNTVSWYATTLNSTTGNVTNLNSNVIAANNFSTANAVISGGYISSLTNAYISTSAVTNFSSGNAVITGGYIENLTNATIVTGNTVSWYTGTLNATEANITRAAVGNFSTANAVITGGYISAISNVSATTANLGNIKIEDITISSLTGNIVISPLLSNPNALTIIDGASALQLPAGNTAQQPTTAYAGALRWNTGVSSLEVYSGTSWIPLLSEINNQVITPDGTSINYTLDFSATAEGIIVSINGTLQQPGTAYTVSGTTITFAEVPLATDIISIRFIAAGITENNVQFSNVAASIIPSANITFDLGSSSRRWRDIWLSGNSINLGAAVITSVGNTVQLPAGSTVGGANVDVTAINANVTAANVGIAELNANIGSYQTYANANVVAIQANLGAYQTYANTNIVSIQANLGAYQIYANANIGSYQTYANANIVAIQANLGAYQTFSNANAASQQTQIDNIVSTANANTAAYLTTYSGNISGSLTTVSQPYITNLDNLTSFGSVSGVTAQGNLTILGNLVVQGNTVTIGSNNLTVVDSIIDLHTFANLNPLTTDDGRDIGIRFHYYKGLDTHAFLGWENTTQTLVYYQRATETDSNVSGTFGNVQFGSLLLSNTTASGSTTSGALQVRGGVGISGGAWVGESITYNSILPPVSHINLNAPGVYYGAIGTVGTQTWNLGWGTGAQDITGSALNWDTDGNVTVTGNLNVAANAKIGNFHSSVGTVIFDFGSSPVREKVFYILDNRLTKNNYVMVVPTAKAGSYPLLGDDELEMDNFMCAANVHTDGNATVYVTATGFVKDQRTFMYMIT